MHKIQYSYKDIVLQPRYSEVLSRKQTNCQVDFLGGKFKSPAIPANMKCTIDFKLAEQLSETGYFYILHRFYDYKKIYDWVKNNQHLKTISISIGVNKQDEFLINNIVANDLRVDYVTIDVAHGHHILVKNMIKFLRQNDVMPFVKIIAGNIGTAQAARDLHCWGADAVKAGLSMGKSCTTYNCTGVGTPMFSLIESIKNEQKQFTGHTGRDFDFPIIADGQVREVGDVCKALVAGATMVMIGSEFAKCKDSPAEIGVTANGRDYKTFYGSASEVNKGHNEYVEGQSVLLEVSDETYLKYIERINQGIQSCMSYAGVDDIKFLIYMDYSIKSL